MEPVLDGHNIIVVGAWNRRLFTPEWVAREFADGAEVTLEMALNNPAFPIRLSYEGLTLLVSNDRLVVNSSRAGDRALERVEGLAGGILGRLQHTPVTALGVNFSWRDTVPEGARVALFDLADNDDLADSDVVVQSTKITRTTRWQDRELNLTVNLTEDGSVEYNMNFNNPVNSTAAAREFIDGNVVTLRHSARELLQAVYKLEFQEV